MTTLPELERRSASDRRQEPTRVWDSLIGVGRRMWLRRLRERQGVYFVDRYSFWSALLIVTLLVLSVVDAAITLHLVPAGYSEVNPVMAELLDWGVVPFLVGKYLLTAAGLPVLLVFKNFKLFGTPLRVFHLIPILVVLYFVLLAYQISLLQSHAGL